MSIFIHNSNIQNKVNTNYKGKRAELSKFHYEVYCAIHKYLLGLNFDETDAFDLLSKAINKYLKDIDEFSNRNNITSQSKFRSTFLEELSEYLFKDLEPIVNGKLGFFNKNVYAGLKIGADMKVSVIHKDVDFCIGRKVKLFIDDTEEEIIMPIVAVEVKTYLDATMFGEVQFSARLIKNAVPNVKTYVIMEFCDVAKEKIIAARHDNTIDEMFSLRCKGEDKKYSFSAKVLKDYYDEVKNAVMNLNSETVNDIGRLLNRKVKM